MSRRCEIDEFAQVAIAMNAAENDAAVTVLAEDVVGADRGWDVVLAGDVSYEKDMAQAVTAWLGGLATRGALVLIGDPRRSYLALDRLEMPCRIQRAGHARAGRTPRSSAPGFSASARPVITERSLTPAPLHRKRCAFAVERVARSAG